MRERHRGRTAAFGAAVSLLTAGAPLAREGQERGEQTGEQERSRERQKDLRTVFFGSLDAGNSRFASLGVKRTLNGNLDESGPVGMLSAGLGAREERVDAVPGARRTMLRPSAEGSALLGYQWALGRVFLAGFVGPELDIGERAASSVSTTRIGARVQGELWAHPSETTLVTAAIVTGTARGHVWGRVSAGQQAWRHVFVGPEIGLYRTETYRELRLGLHATGFEVGRLKVRLSGGWRWDDGRPEGERKGARKGGYLGLSGHIPL